MAAASGRYNAGSANNALANMAKMSTLSDNDFLKFTALDKMMHAGQISLFQMNQMFDGDYAKMKTQIELMKNVTALTIFC